jgi:hypothetical protein
LKNSTKKQSGKGAEDDNTLLNIVTKQVKKR